MSLKKNVAILACAVFIFASFLGVTHAATRNSSRELFSPHKSFSSYSLAFSFINFNSPLVVIDPAMVYSLSGKDKKPPKNPDQPDPTVQPDPTEQPDPASQTNKDKETQILLMAATEIQDPRKKLKTKTK